MKKNYLKLEDIIKNIKDSYGFVLLLDTGKSLKVIMDDSESLRLLTKLVDATPTYKGGDRVLARDFEFNPN